MSEKPENPAAAPLQIELRDWFAGQALVGLLAGADFGSPEQFATMSYEAADALLAERSKP